MSDNSGDINKSLENSGFTQVRIEPDMSSKPAILEPPIEDDEPIEPSSTPPVAIDNEEDDSIAPSPYTFDGDDDVEEMHYDSSLDSYEDPAMKQIVDEGKRSTSDFVWRNIKNGIPEAGGFFTEISTDRVDESIVLDPDSKLRLKENIGELNQQNKSAYEVPQWIEDNIQGPLKDVFVKRGWETSIPPEVELIVGLGILIFWFYNTTRKINKTNKLYIERLDQQLTAIEEKMLSEINKNRQPVTEKKETTKETNK